MVPNFVILCIWFSGGLEVSFPGIDHTSEMKISGEKKSAEFFVLRAAGKSDKNLYLSWQAYIIQLRETVCPK